MLNRECVKTATATSFCKCICFNNSTIIALTPPPSSASAPPHPAMKLLERAAYLETRKDTHHKPTCADCNRALCLSYNLPICKNAQESDVFTTCFQRDSLKDEAVVFIFIFATAALLTWAVAKPWLEKWMALFAERGNYVPLDPGRRRRAETDDGGATT